MLIGQTMKNITTAVNGHLKGSLTYTTSNTVLLHHPGAHVKTLMPGKSGTNITDNGTWNLEHVGNH